MRKTLAWEDLFSLISHNLKGFEETYHYISKEFMDLLGH